MSPSRRTHHESDGADLASMLLRGLLGATMIAHGVRHARTLDGTAGWFDSIGFAQPRQQAAASAGVEIASGAAVLAGSGTPIAAASIVGTMSVAYRTVHRPNGFFITAEGWEYVGALSAAALALAALGPGRPSVDHRLGVDRLGSPLARAALAAGLGVAGAYAHLRMFWSEPA